MWHLSVLRFYRADLCLSCNDTSVRHIFPPAFVNFSVIHITIHGSQALSLYRFVITVVKKHTVQRDTFSISLYYMLSTFLFCFYCFIPCPKMSDKLKIFLQANLRQPSALLPLVSYRSCCAEFTQLAPSAAAVMIWRSSLVRMSPAA